MFQFIVKRMGRWIDFDNDYKTLYPWFMESVWYAYINIESKLKLMNDTDSQKVLICEKVKWGYGYTGGFPR